MSRPKKRGIVSVIEARAQADCDRCYGSGLQLYNTYKNDWNNLTVIVRVCPCVRVVHVPAIKADEASS